MLEIGVRVVRGPNWVWHDQDDGEGHCGTVVELGKSGSSTSPDKTVVVQWDSGSRTNYRVGYKGAYDLLVIDTAPAGVKHQNILCDGCKKQGIWGIRWKCETCFDFDLCTMCYMADKHDVNHIFQRFETANSVGVQVTPRYGMKKIPLLGIFVGAKVVRGVDWDWSDQDGGEGKTGRVLDIRGWDNESGRSVANVCWSASSTNVYRVGHKGKVDLKYVQDAVGGNYIKEHLPILGIQQEDLPRVPAIPSHLTFSVGDKVKVLMDVAMLRQMQEGHGGWNPKMGDCIGKIGTVHRVTDKGDIRVQYGGCNNRWTFHPATLTKVNVFSVNDSVKLSDDVVKFKDLQKDHGEWTEAMRISLGKIGKVKKVYKDGDLRVCVEGQTWTLNPLVVKLVVTDTNNTQMGDRAERESPLAGLLSELHLSPTGPAPNPTTPSATTPTGLMDKVLRDAAQGRLDMVVEFFKEHPTKIDSTSNGKTCLQVACHQGHKDMVIYLLSAGADVSIADQDGDTALHYAAFGDQSEMMELLISRGADINAVNRGRCSSLHVAVNKQHVRCVRALLNHNCNPNIQDSYGDTVLHDAIGKDCLEITEMLSSYQGIDLTLKNNRGFNVLHHAALKGNNAAMEKLLSFARQLVNIKKDDGFAALHLACLNGHRAVAETLLLQGNGDVNLRNNKKQTPLLLAVSQGHSAVVELLISLKAAVDAVDEDGSTALHLVINKRESINTEISELEAPTIFGIYSQISGSIPENTVAIAIACYLVEEGCLLSTLDNKGKSPLDNIADPAIHQLLQGYVRSKPAACDSPVSRVPVECSVCSELAEQNVLFEPCGHRIACEDCASRVKKCLRCGQNIVRRITTDGRVLPCKTRLRSSERLRYLETKIQEIEEAHCCSICMERKRNVVFLCGHGACEKCSQTLKICHMCRKTITKKINLY